LKNADRLDADLWKSLACNKAPGLDLIATSFGLVPDGEILEQLQKVLFFLRGSYRWIVADLGSGFSRHVGHLLQDVDETYIVTTLELAALRQARLMIQKLTQLGRHPDSLRLVVNEEPKRPPFSSSNLEDMLGFPVWATIPYVPELSQGHERATSLPRAVAQTKAVARMADLIAGVPAQKPKRRWPSF
jgi:Flp pilus assembly CpaE family ATPase